MDDPFTDADHERARRAGRAAMGQPPAKSGRALAKPVTLRTLGVVVREASVFKAGAWTTKHLGPLAGARAQLGDASKVHNVGAAALTLMPVLALTTRKETMVYIAFPDGTVYQKKLSGKSAVRSAESEVVRFNALVTAAG